MIKVLFFNLILAAGLVAANNQSLQWFELASIPAIQSDSLPFGIGGAFSGISDDALIIAGGARPDLSNQNNRPAIHNDIYVLLKKNGSDYDEQSDKSSAHEWKTGFHLDSHIAFGASATTDQGLLCVGGTDGSQSVDDVFLLAWDSQTQIIQKTKMASLPVPCKNSSVAVIGSIVYAAAELSNPATKYFWSLDLSQETASWQELPPWPGPPSSNMIAVAQHNGETDCIYLIIEAEIEPTSSGAIEPHSNVWQFNPVQYKRSLVQSQVNSAWRQKMDAPTAFISTALSMGQGFIYLFGESAPDIKATADVGTPCFLYHTITNTWIAAGHTPAPLNGSVSTIWNDRLLLTSVGIKNFDQKIFAAQPNRQTKPFGAVNFAVLIIYLSGMAGIGLYFMNKIKNTEDYFRGSQNIPWWVAGCSIFATMLSSITYMALPSKAFAMDWTYLPGFPIILLVAIFVIFQILPFFRRINATSAYEYLELRFNLGARLLGSSLFILFHIGRMAIVLYLSALALAAITPLTEVQAILIMGLFSLLYSILGGIEAVVWTDTIQTFVLFGGAIIILIFVIQRIDGGIAQMIQIAATEGKLKIIHWDWDKLSFTATAFWVILFGGIGQNLVSYTSDQAVVQRYMTTRDEKSATKAILVNGILSQPVGLLFLTLGAALFVFYKTHPTHLDPTFKIDAVMPMFIAQELPMGVAGLIVAGIFAAAQSTVSTSMNSTATAFITDFMRRFSLLHSERAYFNLARAATLFFGATGVALAVLLAQADIKSMLDSFFSVIGLFGGALAGMFLLGIFSRRANGIGVIVGACTGAFVLYLVQSQTHTHVYLYALIGIGVSVFVGYFSSLIFKPAAKSIEGLTIFTINKKS